MGVNLVKVRRVHTPASSRQSRLQPAQRLRIYPLHHVPQPLTLHKGTQVVGVLVGQGHPQDARAQVLDVDVGLLA